MTNLAKNFVCLILLSFIAFKTSFGISSNRQIKENIQQEYKISIEDGVDSSFCKFYTIVRPTTKSIELTKIESEMRYFWAKLRKMDPNFADTVKLNNAIYEKACTRSKKIKK